MKKSLGVKPYLFPMPVLMIATYDENGTIDVMNMAWGGISDNDKVTCNISEGHKTTKNIKARQAFTIGIAGTTHLAEADFFGSASANKLTNKFERTGMHALKSQNVDAPVILEWPLTVECTVVEAAQNITGYRVVGKIINVLADESVLTSEGEVDPSKLNAFAFSPFDNAYYALGTRIGSAWKSGKKFLS
jgi:flavin reductase (DIM6/NTAB) family NADH-FMN oxidoreductase RutF